MNRTLAKALTLAVWAGVPALWIVAIVYLSPIVPITVAVVCFVLIKVLPDRVLDRSIYSLFTKENS